MHSGTSESMSAGLRAGAEAALERLGASGEALVARTEAWARVNSGSYEVAGLGQMCALLEAALSALPGDVTRHAAAASTRIDARGGVQEVAHTDILELRVRPNAPFQVALTGHYDTVFPAAHPFQAVWREADGRLRGPGVADMKGGIAVMLAALEAFEMTPHKGKLGYTVLLSPDEEIGSPASAAALAALGARAQFGMTYEPALADGAIVSARKGSGNLHVVFTGRAAHVGRDFAAGRNAILAAARAAERLDRLNGTIPGATLNVAAIDGGGPLNMVPDRAVLRFNIRADLAEDATHLLSQARAIAIDAAGEGVRVDWHGGLGRAPKPVTPSQAAALGFAQAAGRALGLDIALRPSGGVCEGNNLFAAGCPNVDTLGPIGGNLHSADEFAMIESFAPRAALSLLMLHGLAGGAFDARELAR